MVGLRRDGDPGAIRRTRWRRVSATPPDRADASRRKPDRRWESRAVGEGKPTYGLSCTRRVAECAFSLDNRNHRIAPMACRWFRGHVVRPTRLVSRTQRDRGSRDPRPRRRLRATETFGSCRSTQANLVHYVWVFNNKLKNIRIERSITNRIPSLMQLGAFPV